MSAISGRRLVLFVLAAIVLGAAPAQAQFQDILGGQSITPGGGPTGATAVNPESVANVSAHFTAEAPGRPAMLSITAQIDPGWYTYSITQKPVAAMPTVIKVDDSNDYRLAGEFRSTLPPKIVQDSELKATFEKFERKVTWQAPVEFRTGVKPADVQIAGSVRMQICNEGSCLPPTSFPFTAKLVVAEAPDAQATTGQYSHPATHATLSGHLEPRTATPGSTVDLVITAEMPPGWHVYQLAARDEGAIGNKPTLIALANTSGFQFEATRESKPTVEAPPAFPGQPPQRYYDDSVTWTTPIVIPADTKPGQYPIEGVIGYQTCLEDQRCDAPRGARFAATLNVGKPEQAGSIPLAFSDAKYGEAAQIAASQPAPIQTAQAPPLGWTLPIVILAGLAGGFVLNFMPCVLPVIGLKLLSFAEQAGRSRAQILALNVWYALGTFAVFMALATLATGVSWGLADSNLGWGEQFQYTSFNVVMVGLVFVMALSFLGVWEIPIPGFVGSGKANELAAREGAAGAFSKGVLATILATPCSGPALGPVFGFTLNQPALITYLLFSCIALGMSAPYLLIGAFPTLIRFLPKPGAWMETFKNVMGFVLLGTIVFLFSFMDKDYLVPTFAMMVGLWAACWWIGRTSPTVTFGRKLLAWGEGTAVAGLIALAAFTWLVPRESVIPWQPFSQAELARLRQEGNTVLVDFTADWCLTCKLNLRSAIETDKVSQAIADNEVVPLLADYTKRSADIKDALASLNSTSIPLLAVFPADPSKPPIIRRDVVTQQQVLDAIAEAGPSKDTAALTATTETQARAGLD